MAGLRIIIHLGDDLDMSGDKGFESGLEKLRELRERINELEVAYPIIDHRDGFISRIMENLQDILMEIEMLFKNLKNQIDHIEEGLSSLAKEFEKVRS